MTKNPWMKFYPTDWRADSALRMCGAAARGLWIEMVCIMHEAEPRGHLTVQGRKVMPEQLAALSGIPLDQVILLLAELFSNGVYSVKKNGNIFSRRMENEENKSRKNRENGRLGGNPSLSKQNEIDTSLNHEDNTQKPEARSQKLEAREDTPVVPEEDFEQQAIDGWNSMASETGLPTVQQFTTGRRKKVGLRLKDLGGIIGWNDLLLTVRKSPHLLGQTPGKNGGAPWRADFDWIVEPRNFTKVMEGNYVRDNNANATREKPASFFESILADTN